MQTALVSVIDFQFLSRMLSDCVRIVGLCEDCGYCEKGGRAGAYLSGSLVVLFYILWHFRAAIVEGLLGLRPDWLDCVVLWSMFSWICMRPPLVSDLLR